MSSADTPYHLYNTPTDFAKSRADFLLRDILLSIVYRSGLRDWAVNSDVTT